MKVGGGIHAWGEIIIGAVVGGGFSENSIKFCTSDIHHEYRERGLSKHLNHRILFC